APPGAVATYEPRRTEAALPYNILARLPGVQQLPGIASEDFRAASLIGLPGGSFSSRLQREGGSMVGPRSGAPDSLRGVPGVSTRMLTIENGGTLMGMLQEAGVNQQDALSVIDSMRDIFSPRSVRAGQVFEANFGLEETVFP